MPKPAAAPFAAPPAWAPSPAPKTEEKKEEAAPKPAAVPFAAPPAWPASPAETKKEDAKPTGGFSFGATPNPVPPSPVPATPRPPAPPTTPLATPAPPATSDQVEFGLQLLESLKAGELDLASAQKQLKDLMVSGTPPGPSPRGAPSPGPMPRGFTPVKVTESAAITGSPTPQWGKKVESLRAAFGATPPTKGGDPGAAGLKAIMEDIAAAMEEATAMLDDVAGLVDAVEVGTGGRDDAAPFAAKEIEELASTAAELATGVAAAAAATSSLRPAAADVWAENIRDEAMRSELESLFERAAEDAEAAREDREEEKAESAAEERAAREAGGNARVRHRQKFGPRAQEIATSRPLPPALDRLRRGIDDDMSRLTDAMAALESAVERKERERRRAKLLERGAAAAELPGGKSATLIPWGTTSPYGGRKGAALHSAAMPRAGANHVPSSLIRAGGYGSVSASNGRVSLGAGFGGIRGSARGTLKSASTAARSLAAAAVPLPESSGKGGRPADAVTPAEREEAMRELRRRREMIDSQTARLEEVLGKIRAGETKENLAKNAPKPSTPTAKQPIVDSHSPPPASLAAFSPISRFASKGAFDSPAVVPRPAGLKPKSPDATGRALVAPTETDPAEESAVVRAVLSKISHPRITSTVKKDRPAAGLAFTAPTAPAPSFGAVAAPAPAPGGFNFGAAPAPTPAAPAPAFGAAKPAAGGFSFAPPAITTSEKKDEPKKEEAKPAAAPKAGGFNAAFLAKANAGYDAAQKALQEDLDKAAGNGPAEEPAAPKAGAAGAFSFGGAAASSAASSSFGFGTAGSTPSFGAPASSAAASSASGTPAFGLGASSSAAASSKPAFSFPGSAGGSAGFSFGGSASSAAATSESKPAAGGFSFAPPAITTGKPAEEKKEEPEGGKKRSRPRRRKPHPRRPRRAGSARRSSPRPTPVRRRAKGSSGGPRQGGREGSRGGARGAQGWRGGDRRLQLWRRGSRFVGGVVRLWNRVDGGGEEG